MTTLTPARSATRADAAPAWLPAAAAAAVFWACEHVAWGGQPGAGTGGDGVLAYYGGHAATVIAGDVAWVAACLALLVGASWLARGLRPWSGRLVVASAAAVAAFAAASSLVAAVLAILSAVGTVGPADALRLWQLEGGLFGIAGTLMAVPPTVGGIAVLRDVAPSRRSAATVLAVVAALVAAERAFGVLGGDGFAIAPLWLAAAAVVASRAR